jgi:hypothetical protein
MAFVDTVDTDNETVDIVRSDTTPGVHIDLPDFDDAEATGNFLGELNRLGNIRGAKTLKKYVTKYLDAARLAERHMHQVKTSVNTINGVPSARTGVPGVSNELRKFKRASHTYFSGLNTPELRRQCEVFGLDYDGYDTMDEAIAALVDTNVAMRNK